MSLKRSVSAGETDCSWVWHWAMHAKNNQKAATQGECPSHNPRVLLAKSCVSRSYWSSHSRNERQALITGGSLPRPVSPPKKTWRIKERLPRWDACGAHNEMLRWKTKWLHSTGERPATLAGTLDCINLTLYWNVNTVLTIVLTMPVSTATPEHSFSMIHRVKTYWSTGNHEDRATLGSYFNAHVQGHNHWREAVAREICGKKNRMLN